MWSQKATIDLHFTLVSSRFPRNRNSNGVLCWCSSSTIVESNAISLACYYNEDSSLLSTHSFSVSLFCDTHTHKHRGRFIPSNARVCLCLCCVSIHFNWIYIVSLFAVVFNSFRRYRQPFISIQTRSVQTKHHQLQTKNNRIRHFRKMYFVCFTHIQLLWMQSNGFRCIFEFLILIPPSWSSRFQIKSRSFHYSFWVRDINVISFSRGGNANALLKLEFRMKYFVWFECE